MVLLIGIEIQSLNKEKKLLEKSGIGVNIGRYALYSLPATLPLIVGTAAGVANYTDGYVLHESLQGDGPLITAARAGGLTILMEVPIGILGILGLVVNNMHSCQP